MGVLSCSRRGCSNIMCDTYVPDVGYICFSCQDEFKNYLVENSITVKTGGEIKVALKAFMDTHEGDFKEGSGNDVGEFFKEHTR